MSIFESIKNAIFGHKATATTAAPNTAAASSTSPASATGTASTTGAAPPAGPQSAAQGSTAAGGAPVDVEANLQSIAAQSGQTLNWRTSIVDLMKLLNLDSSIGNRKALAKELGYTGNTDDSATMNIWLHKQVMNKLAENGGKVPASLRG